MKSWKVLLLLTVIRLCVCKASAQVSVLPNAILYSTAAKDNIITDSTSLFTIDSIVITGNSRTKESTVLRELSFKEGQQYPLSELVAKFAETKKQLMNTGLFRDVVVSLQNLQGFDAIVKIDVKERWYIYPFPFVRMIDRSFGEWVKQQHMDLARINYGVRIEDKNITGRNDKLYVYLMGGYTKQVALRYNGLFLDKDMKWSANLGVSFGKNKELNYITVNNKLKALKNSDEYVHSFFQSFLEVNYRPAINTRHTFGVAYNYQDVADTIYKLNPFFSTQRTVTRYPEILYRIAHYNTDFNPYPTKGFVAEGELNKKGLNHHLNLWEVRVKGSAYWPLSDKYFFNLAAAASLKLPFKQPYITQQLMGYNDMFMQGYEYYIIDGVAGGYTKATFSRQILNTAIHIPTERFKVLNNIPIRIFAKVYGNTGYVYNKQPGNNELCNKMLYSGGFGLDIVAFYDFILKIDWSFNQLGQNGLYLHRKSYF